MIPIRVFAFVTYDGIFFLSNIVDAFFRKLHGQKSFSHKAISLGDGISQQINCIIINTTELKLIAGILNLNFIFHGFYRLKIDLKLFLSSHDIVQDLHIVLVYVSCMCCLVSLKQLISNHEVSILFLSSCKAADRDNKLN